MNTKNLLLVALALFLFQHSRAQRNTVKYNLLGITGGITFFDIHTDDLVTKQRNGFGAGFTTRGAFYNDFDLVYGINYFNSKVSIEGQSGSDTREIEYNIQGAQLNFLGSYNFIFKHLSVEFGPVLQINSKMKLDDEKYAGYKVSGYDGLSAGEIQDISKINFNVAAGVTVGFEHFRAVAQYQYGVTNMLNNLNEKELENEDFQGHGTTLSLGAVVYF